METKRIYAIVTNTYYGALCVNSGTVGIFSSKNRAVDALNKQRNNVKGCGANFVEDEEFMFSYNYDDMSNILYRYRIMWYTLNDVTLTQYDRVLPRINEQ